MVLLACLCAQNALAIDCSELPNGVLDGATGVVAPSQIQIDRNCTIRNFTAANPLDTNFSFLTQPGQTDERWLIVFDNVLWRGRVVNPGSDSSARVLDQLNRDLQNRSDLHCTVLNLGDGVALVEPLSNQPCP